MFEKIGLFGNMNDKWKYFRRLTKIIKHCLFVSWILYTSIYVSMIIYYWFYTWYIPRAQFSTNVMFELQTIDPINKQYELIGSADLFNEKGPILYLGQEYTIKLELDVPESERNFDIGIFGVSAELYDMDDKLTTTFKTTGTLKYRSTFLRYILVLFQLPLLIFGRDQKQAMNIILKDHYIENSFTGANRIIIKMKDKLQFYSANLVIQSKFTGLRYYMYHWSYTTGFVLTSLLCFLIFLMLITYFYDLRSFIRANLSNHDDKIKLYDDAMNDIAFASTASELKEFLDNNQAPDDSDVIIGLENFRRRKTVDKKVD